MPGKRILFVIPVFNDWDAAARLLRELDREVARIGGGVRVLVVDDGSWTVPDWTPETFAGTRFEDVEVLTLRRNLGHQRAIAIGLSYAEAKIPGDAVAIMDADGEDRPQDVPRLLEEFERRGAQSVVFAERTKRSENRLFVVMYALYRLLHRLLTGERVRVGNFSVVPAPLLTRLVASSDLWNHYAAAVFKARVPYTTIPTHRGTRYTGSPQMNYVSLISHGLSAMSVFGDRIGVRLLVATIGCAALSLAVVAGLLLRNQFIGESVPVWAPYVLGLIVITVLQAIGMSLAFAFIILAGRDSSTFLPFRDYQDYVAHVRSVLSKAHAGLPI